MRVQDQDNPWQWQPVTRPQAEAFVRWQYEPPYDFYNVLADPDDAPAAAQQADYFLKPATRCHTLVDAAGEVIAFCTFGEDARVPGGDYSQNALDIGLAVRPDLTGRGLGSAIVSALVAFARRRFRPPLLRVTIAEWNRRAQRVWAGQGFEVTSRFLAESHTQQPFLILQLPRQETNHMITHVVLFKLREPTPDIIATAVARIRALEGQIPTLRELEVGSDVTHSNRSYDIALITRFDDLAGLAVYRDHPAHVPVLDYMREVSETSVAVDFRS